MRKTILSLLLLLVPLFLCAQFRKNKHRSYGKKSKIRKEYIIGIGSKTKTGMVLGTPSYMSPEQLAGKKVDGRSDLYSLGVMLFQMLTGELPFKADSMATLMYKITHDPHPSVTELNPQLPVQLEIIVAKTLEKNADDRYQSGAALAADLLRLSGTH